MKQAETGLAARLGEDAILSTLVGEDATGALRVYSDWPHEVLEDPRPAHFPRITLLRIYDRPIRPGVAEVGLQVDIWVWPTGQEGGRGRLDEIDERLMELVDEQHWRHGGARLSAVVEGGQDFPAPPSSPLRRARDVTILVSPG